MEFSPSDLLTATVWELPVATGLEQQYSRRCTARSGPITSKISGMCPGVPATSFAPSPAWCGCHLWWLGTLNNLRHLQPPVVRPLDDEEFGAMKPGEGHHPPGGFGASWLSGIGGIRRIAFPIVEDRGSLVAHCLSLSDSRGGSSGCLNVAELVSLRR